MSGPTTFLIFEGGELEDNAYLLQDERPWNGRDACAKSALVSLSLNIAGGLRMGQPLAAVEAIIGKPSLQIGNQVWFFFERWTPRSKKALAEMHLREAQMDDDEFLKRFRYAKEGISVLTRFKDSHLFYVAVSHSAIEE
jgi:hypothetical protein